MNARVILLVALALFTLYYIWRWFSSVRAGHVPPGETRQPPSLMQLALGFVTNFFDTLGIGSFAPTTSVFKFTKMVPDERIPGTLNVGHTLPTITQAFIFTLLVKVDFTTLVLLIAAAVLGAQIGAGIVSGWPRRNIQIGMGAALAAAAALFAMKNLNIGPPGGTDLALSGGRLAIGMAGNFVLGALMSLGIGLYAPCMILISLLGMDPTAAFPIMMGSCAFLMPIGSAKFISTGKYSLAPALGLAIGGVPAVLIAAFIVKSLPLTTVRWLVVGVVLYTAVVMLRSAMVERGAPVPAPAGD
ncbi:MAG: sulfite exporter TauE/SafE family protein [Gemmatimonadaceae bacterium]